MWNQLAKASVKVSARYYRLVLEAYLGSSQIYMMELFTEIVNGFISISSENVKNVKVFWHFQRAQMECRLIFP